MRPVPRVKASSIVAARRKPYLPASTRLRSFLGTWSVKSDANFRSGPAPPL